MSITRRHIALTLAAGVLTVGVMNAVVRMVQEAGAADAGANSAVEPPGFDAEWCSDPNCNDETHDWGLGCRVSDG